MSDVAWSASPELKGHNKLTDSQGTYQISNAIPHGADSNIDDNQMKLLRRCAAFGCICANYRFLTASTN